MLLHLRPLRLELQCPLQDPECQYVFSLGASSCWSDEDYIGRIARANRKTHSLACEATIKKTLIEYALQWQRASKSWNRAEPPGQ